MNTKQRHRAKQIRIAKDIFGYLVLGLITGTIILTAILMKRG